jgi:hypothetical protein
MLARKHVWSCLALGFGLAALAAACTDDSGGSGGGAGTGGTGGGGGTGGAAPECREAVADCGGDPTGRWKVAGWCGHLSTVTHFGNDPACQNQRLDEQFTFADGRFEYRADGSLEIEIHAEYDLDYAITPACAQVFAAGVTGDVCAAFQRAFGSSPGFTGATCSGTDEGGCSCQAVFVDEREVPHRWNLDGGVLHEDEATYTRCIEGDYFVRSPRFPDGTVGWTTNVLVRDDPDPALACVDETPDCGGDPTGSWELAAACGTLAFEAQIAASEPCQAQPATYEFDDAAGTLELRADGTLVSNLTYELDFRVEVTPACVADLRPQYGDVCGSVARGYQNAGYPDTACATTDEDGCYCAASIQADDVGTRAWNLDGGGLHDGDAVYRRCVAGDVFRRSTDHNAGGEGWSTEVFVRAGAAR